MILLYNGRVYEAGINLPTCNLSVDIGSTSVGIPIAVRLFASQTGDEDIRYSWAEAGENPNIVTVQVKNDDSIEADVINTNHEGFISPHLEAVKGKKGSFQTIDVALVTSINDTGNTHIRTLGIYNKKTGDMYYQITFTGKSESVDPSLASMAQLRGLRIDEEDTVIFKEVNPYDPVFPSEVLNRKRKEYLLNIESLKPPVLSLTNLRDVLQFFGYTNMYIGESWVNPSTGETVSRLVGNTTLDESYDHDSNIIRLPRISLVYKITRADFDREELADGIPHVYTEEIDIDGISFKLEKLKSTLNDKFLTASVQISDIIGECETYYRILIQQAPSVNFYEYAYKEHNFRIRTLQNDIHFIKQPEKYYEAFKNAIMNDADKLRSAADIADTTIGLGEIDILAALYAKMYLNDESEEDRTYIYSSLDCYANNLIRRLYDMHLAGKASYLGDILQDLASDDCMSKSTASVVLFLETDDRYSVTWRDDTTSWKNAAVPGAPTRADDDAVHLVAYDGITKYYPLTWDDTAQIERITWVLYNENQRIERKSERSDNDLELGYDIPICCEMTFEYCGSSAEENNLKWDVPYNVEAIVELTDGHSYTKTLSEPVIFHSPNSRITGIYQLCGSDMPSSSKTIEDNIEDVTQITEICNDFKNATYTYADTYPDNTNAVITRAAILRRAYRLADDTVIPEFKAAIAEMGRLYHLKASMLDTFPSVPAGIAITYTFNTLKTSYLIIGTASGKVYKVHGEYFDTEAEYIERLNNTISDYHWQWTGVGDKRYIYGEAKVISPDWNIEYINISPYYPFASPFIDIDDIPLVDDLSIEWIDDLIKNNYYYTVYYKSLTDEGTRRRDCFAGWLYEAIEGSEDCTGTPLNKLKKFIYLTTGNGTAEGCQLFKCILGVPHAYNWGLISGNAELPSYTWIILKADTMYADSTADVDVHWKVTPPDQKPYEASSTFLPLYPQVEGEYKISCTIKFNEANSTTHTMIINVTDPD